LALPSSHIRTPFPLQHGLVLTSNSPLGRGLLTGQIKGRQDLEEGDFRLLFSRFKEGVSTSSRYNLPRCSLTQATVRQNIGQNLQFVDFLSIIANRKGITLAQLCIAWVGALGDHVIPLPGSS
jgi:pyridoxine 4-dehydrogenase